MPQFCFDLETQGHTLRVLDRKEFATVSDANFHAQLMIRNALRYDDDDRSWYLRIRVEDRDFELIVLFPLQKLRHHIASIQS
jgi:hypothetical protein